jgi:hypothetical protein
MAPVQIQIMKVLRDSSCELSMNDLVNRVQENSQASVAEVKAAVLPMISGERIELTPDLKLRLHAKE